MASATSVTNASNINSITSTSAEPGGQGFTPCTPDPQGDSLGTERLVQEHGNWCWAACVQMVLKTLGDTIEQCDVVVRKYSPSMSDCCRLPTRPHCDVAGWPNFPDFQFDADTTTNQALSWDTVKHQIGCLRSPFCASWKGINSHGQPNGDDHMSVVCGYKIRGAEQLVKILDPYTSQGAALRWRPYEFYVGDNTRIHWDDYYNIRRLSNR
jgi:hypothetical protein